MVSLLVPGVHGFMITDGAAWIITPRERKPQTFPGKTSTPDYGCWSANSLSPWIRWVPFPWVVFGIPNEAKETTNSTTRRATLARRPRRRGPPAHWVGLLASFARRCGWRLFAWAMTSNRFHLDLRTPQPNLAAGRHDRSSYREYLGLREAAAWLDCQTVPDLGTDCQSVPDCQ